MSHDPFWANQRFQIIYKNDKTTYTPIVKPYAFYLWNCLSINYCIVIRTIACVHRVWRQGFLETLVFTPCEHAFYAYNNEVINYHSTEDNTKTGYWKTEKENIKILLMKYSLKKIQAIVKKN